MDTILKLSGSGYYLLMWYFFNFIHSLKVSLIQTFLIFWNGAWNMYLYMVKGKLLFWTSVEDQFSCSTLCLITLITNCELSKWCQGVSCPRHVRTRFGQISSTPVVIFAFKSNRPQIQKDFFPLRIGSSQFILWNDIKMNLVKNVFQMHSIEN